MKKSSKLRFESPIFSLIWSICLNFILKSCRNFWGQIWGRYGKVLVNKIVLHSSFNIFVCISNSILFYLLSKENRVGMSFRSERCWSLTTSWLVNLSLSFDKYQIMRLGNGILLPKLFWPTVRKNCSIDREKLLKFEAESQEFAKNLRSLEQFIQTVKGQNNVW